jgi:uncharacterized coiled-coil DUF342 family protein
LLAAEKGHNRFLWDMRTDVVNPDVKNVFVFGSYAGYLVSPGVYKAKLELNGVSSETDLTILGNPNINATAKDWEEQQQVLSSITSSISDIHKNVNDIRKIKKQLVNQSEILKENTAAQKVLDEAKKLIKDIDTWEANIVEGRIQNGQDVINWPSKINVEFFNILNRADAADPRITDGIKKRLSDLQSQWTSEKSKLTAIKKSIADYNSLYKSQQLDAIQL